MENLEKIVQRIWSDPAFKPALLVGGLIFYLPIINFLLLGYLALYLKKLHKKEGLRIIPWSEGSAIFRETIRILPIILVYGLAPSLLAGFLAWALQGLFFNFGLSFFAHTLGYAPIAFALIIIPPLFFTALWRYVRRGDVKSSLLFSEIFQLAIRKGRLWIRPLLLFVGWMTITWPLAGFGFFASILPLVALMYSQYEESINR